MASERIPFDDLPTGACYRIKDGRTLRKIATNRARLQRTASVPFMSAFRVDGRRAKELITPTKCSRFEMTHRHRGR